MLSRMLCDPSSFTRFIFQYGEQSGDILQVRSKQGLLVYQCRLNVGRPKLLTLNILFSCTVIQSLAQKVWTCAIVDSAGDRGRDSWVFDVRKQHKKLKKKYTHMSIWEWSSKWAKPFKMWLCAGADNRDVLGMSRGVRSKSSKKILYQHELFGHE